MLVYLLLAATASNSVRAAPAPDASPATTSVACRVAVNGARAQVRCPAMPISRPDDDRKRSSGAPSAPSLGR